MGVYERGLLMPGCVRERGLLMPGCVRGGFIDAWVCTRGGGVIDAWVCTGGGGVIDAWVCTRGFIIASMGVYWGWGVVYSCLWFSVCMGTHWNQLSLLGQTGLRSMVRNTIVKNL